MKKCFLLLLILIAVFFCKARESGSGFIRISKLKEINYFYDLEAVKLAKSKSDIGINKIQNLSFTPNKRLIEREINHYYYYTLDLFNDTKNTKTYYIYTANNDYVWLYKSVDNQYQIFGKAGNYVTTPDLQIKKTAYYLKLKISPNQRLSFLVKVFNKRKSAPDLNLSLETESTYNQEVLKTYQENLNETFVTIIFIGSVGFIFFFMAFIYLKSYQKLYLYYALYLLGTIIYSFTHLSRITLLGSLIDYFPLFRAYFNEPIQFAFFAVYNWFVIELLEVEKYSIKLKKILHWLAVSYLIYAFLTGLMMIIYFDHHLKGQLFLITRVILFPLNIALVIYTYKKVKSPILNYFIMGVSIYLFAGLLAALVDSYLRYTSWYTLHLSAANIFELGILAEALCFSLAIGYRIKLNDDEKRKNQEELINQLQINQQLTENAKNELEEKVQLRTKELIQINKQIEEKTIAELKLVYQKKITELEMMALRSQMNPHFIFNSLASIKYFILSKQEDKATDYLNRFSKLIRLILENSRNELIPINQELEAIKLYLDIEANRFNNQFQYHIEIEEDLPLTQIMIPPLLIQPFVENAIWHGLLKSKMEIKTLNITLQKDKSAVNTYHCIIDDNGIGRDSSLRQKNNLETHHSYGLELTKERMLLYNENNDGKISFEIIDKFENRISTGTQVIFTLKTK